MAFQGNVFTGPSSWRGPVRRVKPAGQPVRYNVRGQPIFDAEWSPIAGAFVVRDHAPPSPAVEFVHRLPGYIRDFFLAMAGAATITLAIAWGMGLLR